VTDSDVSQPAMTTDPANRRYMGACVVRGLPGVHPASFRGSRITGTGRRAVPRSSGLQYLPVTILTHPEGVFTALHDAADRLPNTAIERAITFT
jgi:hypothetical protein